jgi:hypothetical protein
MPSPYVNYAEYHETSGSGYGFMDHLWYGSRATVASAAHSVANSAIWYGNALGITDTDPIDTSSALRDYDDDLAAYYNEHKTAIDTIGFIGTSLIPGILAVKATKAFQTGKWGGAGSRITGLLGSKRDDVIKNALDEIKTASTGLSGQLRAAKNRAGVMGLKDNLVQSLAAETAIIATMHQAPIFEDMDMKDMAWTSLIGVGLGTGIGAGLDYFANSTLLKQALREREKVVRPFEAGGEAGAGAYKQGDRIAALINHIDSLPAVPYASSYAPAMAAVKEKTIQQTLQKAQALANEMAGGDAALGKAMLDMELAARAKGATVDDFYNVFGNSTSITRAHAGSHLDDWDKLNQRGFYIRKRPGAQVNGFGDIISTEPIADQIADVAYKVLPGQAPTITYIGMNGVDSAIKGYAKGYDIVIDAKHVVHINPNSKAITRTARPGEDTILSITQEKARKATGLAPANLQGSIYMDLSNGAYADHVLAGVSDLHDISKAGVVGKGEELVLNGKILAKFSDNPFESAVLPPSYLDFAARWSLAGKRGIKNGDDISEWDLPFLVKAKQGGYDPQQVNLPPDLEISIETALRDTVDNMLDAGRSMDEIAHAVNLPRQVVDKLDFSWQAVAPHYTNSEWMKFTELPRFARLTYNIGGGELPTAGMTIRGMAQVQERMRLVQEVNHTASATFFGNTFNQLPALQLNHLRNNATATTGAGAGGVSFADGSYGSLASQAQFIGATVHRYIQDKLNVTIEKLAFSGSAKIVESKEAATELGLIANAVQRTGEKYRAVRDINGNYIGIAIANVADVANAGVAAGKDARVAIQEALTAGKLSLPSTFTVAANAAKGEKQAFIAITDPNVASVIKAHHEITGDFANQSNRFFAAQGLRQNLNPDDIYFAPVDTKRFQHIAFIREKQGYLGKTSTVGAVFGRDLSEFQTNLARIDTNSYDIIKKSDTELYHRAQGDYEYSLMMNENAADQFLKREGILAEFYPSLNGKELIERQLDYYRKQVSKLTRNYTELHYAREFEELRTLGDAYTAEATSLSRKVAKGYEATVDDPFRSYIKTALDLSRLSEHRLWAEANEKADAFLSSAWRTAKDAFGLAAKKEISFEAANDAAEKAGLGRVYENMANELYDAKMQFQSYQNTSYGRQTLTKLISTANSALATVTLRLDMANSLVNTISTPVLMGPELRSILKNLDKPELVGELSKLLTYKVPGGDNTLPTATRLISKAIANFFDRGVSQELRAKYRSMGFVRNNLDLYHSMLDDIAVTGYETPKALEAAMDKIVEKGVILSGSDYAEEFTRFVTANVMDQLTMAAKLDPKVANAYINTFVNRVNGIYLASQRPVMFQGPLGQAIGLFQTYQFNLMQNVFRHARDGNKKSVSMLMALQGSIFGLQGLPGFHIINQHLVGMAPNNPEHKDFFSEAPDFLLYGSAAWLTDSALYTRGDITPRNMTVVPINPMDTPIVNATAKFINNGFDFVKNLSGGAGVVESFAYAVEHNGVSRPLSGLAVSLKGERTTGQGNLIARNMDMLSWSTAMRLIGSKPMDEAVAMDANYRMLAYRAHDKELRAELGKALKIKMLAGEEITTEEMEEAAVKYAKYGGSQSGFNRFVVNLTRNTDEAVANQLMNKANSPLGRRMQEVMGGEELPDYSNSPADMEE